MSEKKNAIQLKRPTRKSNTGPTYPGDISTISDEDPNLLYHYTSWTGLKGVISEKSIRMTHTNFLNDRMEMQHGIDFVPEIITKMASSKELENREIIGSLRSSWDAMGPIKAFVTSFCERGDSLEQWRGYTPAGGCSIAFSATSLRKAAHRQKYWMLPCLYKGLEKRQRIEKIVKWHLQKYDLDEEKDLFDDDVCSDLMIEVPRFKHFAFRSEREWRIFVFDSTLDAADQLEFSIKSSGIIPHLPLKFPSSSIKRIILSPYSAEEAQSGIEMFLQKYGFDHVEVVRSRVPLRS